MNAVLKKRENPAKTHDLWKRIKKSRICYLYAAPYLLLFLAFTILPVLISIGLSFTNFNMLELPKFVGIKNYLQLFFSDDTFMKAIQNTLLLAILTGPGGFLLSLLLAWCINEFPPKFRAALTLLFYAPSISGNVYLIWSILFSGDSYGYVNAALLKIGLIQEPILWFQNTSYMMPLVVIVSLWVSFGTGFLSFIAGLQGVDKTLYESAAMDGVKSRWQELWYITLPSMRPQLMFGAIMSITSAFNVGDVITGVMGFPSYDYVTHTLMHHLQDYGGARFEMGYASAIAVVLFALMVGCNLIIQRFLSKIGQ